MIEDAVFVDDCSVSVMRRPYCRPCGPHFPSCGSALRRPPHSATVFMRLFDGGTPGLQLVDVEVVLAQIHAPCHAAMAARGAHSRAPIRNERRSTNQPSVAFTNNASKATAAMVEIHSIILTRSAGRIAILLLCAPGEETYPLLDCCRPVSARWTIKRPR